MLEPENSVLAEELVQAIYAIKPSFVKTDVVIEIYQPIVGDVHGTIMEICRNGLPYLTVRTLIPGHPELNGGQNGKGGSEEDCGQIVYMYERGVVSDHYMPMSKDAIQGDNFMVHVLHIQFVDAKILMNEWHPPENNLKLFVVTKDTDPKTT